VGVRGFLARRHLLAARTEVTATQQAFASRDRAAIAAHLRRLGTETAAARRLTSDPVWTAFAHVPYAGRTLRTAGGLARAVDDLARETFPSLDAVAANLSDDSLRPAGDRIALAPLVSSRAALERVRDSLARTEGRVRALPSSFVAGPVSSARSDLLAELGPLRGSASTAALAARVAPDMLGGNGTRRYFLAILNNAEMRGSGGLLGAYAILEADHGRLRLRELGTNEDLRDTYPTPAVAMEPDFVRRYTRFGSDSFWLNANMSPHFPDAVRVWTALWAEAHDGERLDGAIAVDPVALSGILRVAGPATLPGGEVVGADNVVALTESEAYARFAKDNKARDRYLLTVARAAYERLLSARATGDLLAALGDAAGAGHLRIGSVRDGEQALLAGLPIAGALPETGTAAFLEVVTQNAGGNKLDYHLRRDVTYTRVAPGRSRVEIRLRNVAPAGLPPYVTNRLDLPGLRAAVAGQHRLYLSVYGSRGAGLVAATVNGAELAMESEVERGHPVFSAFVDVDPGTDLVVVLTLADPGRGPLVLRQPPLVVPDAVHLP
jgi:hypothetical protein